MYTCPNCYESYEGNLWNEMTRAVIKETITKIQDDYYEECLHYCPNCCKPSTKYEMRKGELK